MVCNESWDMLGREGSTGWIRDLSLSVHFLYQCDMVLSHGPAPLGDRKQSWVHSFLREKWTCSQIMTNSFAPSSPKYILGPFFTRYISSEHSDNRMAFFRHTFQEKVNFVLSQHHTREMWELVLPALLHNGHKQIFKWSYRWNHELKIKTYIKKIPCDAKPICFNPFITL